MKIKIKDIAVKAGGVAAGAVIGKFANRFLGNLNPKIRAVGKIVVGAVVPAVMPKSKIADHVGTGVMAVGAAELFEEFVPSTSVSGANDIMSGAVGAPVTIDEDFEEGVSGPDDEVLSGNDDDDISGADDDDDISGADDDDDDDL